MDGLNKMFSEKEMAGSEVRAGAYPFMWVQSVLVIEMHCDWHFH
jgi:hypothetical protein